MKNHGLRLFILFLILFPFPVFAHPPSNMALNYDSQRKVLLIKMDHVSANMRDHFIRKISVDINNQNRPLEYYYPKQTTAEGVQEEIELNAKPGDVITVKAYCSKGGIGEGSLTVPEEKPERKDRKD